MATTNPFGFDDAMKARCRETCAEFGEPPCWKLPELVQPCEQITPCDECRNGIGEAE